MLFLYYHRVSFFLFPVSIPIISPAHYFQKKFFKNVLVCLQPPSDFLLPVGIKFKLLFTACRFLKLCPLSVSLVASLTTSLLTPCFPAKLIWTRAISLFYAYIFDVLHSWGHLSSLNSHDLDSAYLLRKRLSRTVSAFLQTQLIMSFPIELKTFNTPLLEIWSKHLH